ncbi:universal stress protein [Dactylosporangium sp. CA-233914]|uniref:universal stress protein n=1 Tax=Dactylosporangium sp. CA-233914 TaxID=3239934 RepID=UPI003D924902
MTYQYGPVVVGVDGSQHSIGALRWAADEACRWTRMLLAVSVLPPDAALDAQREQERIADWAAEEARRWRVGVAAVGETHRGRPIEVLRRLAEDARLVVVGGRGAGEHLDPPLGSVARALGHRADAPVLIVHNAQRWASPEAVLPHTGPVVVGFDGSEPALRTLRPAFEEAAARCDRLVIVQAWRHPDLWHPGSARGSDLSTDEAAVHEALCETIRPWHAEHPLLEVEVRSEPGDPVDALAAASQWATLLVLGTQCPADHARPPHPSVTARLLEYAACPVLVAHGPARIPAHAEATAAVVA